jgi:hypothetical protein
MLRTSRQRSIAALGLVVLAATLAGLAGPGLAAPAPQLTPFPTPTPGPDGRIVYVVQPGDTLWRVSAITGVSLDELRTLNNLGTDEVIVEGQQLLLGLAGPAEATAAPAGPSPTPQPTGPTPTPLPGSGTLCVMVYNDLNGDSMRQSVFQTALETSRKPRRPPPASIRSASRSCRKAITTSAWRSRMGTIPPRS